MKVEEDLITVKNGVELEVSTRLWRRPRGQQTPGLLQDTMGCVVLNVNPIYQRGGSSPPTARTRHCCF